MASSGASSCVMPLPVNNNDQTKRRGKAIKDQPKKSNSRFKAWISPHRKGYVSLVYKTDCVLNYRLFLPLPFMRANGLADTAREIDLVGRDGIKMPVNLCRGNRGRMSLGKGWNNFAEANGIKVGKSFGLQLVWEDAETPVFHLTNSTGGGCEKGSTSTEPNREEGTSAATS